MNRLRPNPLPVVQLRAALASSLDALPDAELLDRFARYADHPAFEVLLRRHGPMVFGVCRRTLGGSADADDAFQATFLVFLRKAKTVRGERLGPWLYGVAWRVAQKARTRAARLAAHRTEGVDMLPAADENAPIPDWLPVLDAELNALPAKYRDALVFCELQGRSRAEAARELGLREGTLSSRLARGRELLRKRLLKHGTLLPAGGVAALFTVAEVGRATVPAALLTVVSELAKSGATGAVPVAAARLTDEVLKSMFLTKLRTTGALALLVCATAGLTAGWSPESSFPAAESNLAAKASEPPKRTEDKPVVAPQPADKKPVAPKLTDREALQGWWIADSVDFGNNASDDEKKALLRQEGRLHFLVAGDVFWKITAGRSVVPQKFHLDTDKNPRWLTLSGFDPDESRQDKAIYELDGDALRVCMSVRGNGPRPAEFTREFFSPEDEPLMVLHLRRGKRLPVSETGLVGSWAGTEAAVQENINGPGKRAPAPRIEVIGGYLFARPVANGNAASWFGGTYTIDATKNPKWVDVDLFAPVEEGKGMKLYGCYEMADGRLRMALGTRRTTRPLDFKGDNDTFVFDVTPAKPPRTDISAQPTPQIVPAGAPANDCPLPDKMEVPLNPKDLADEAAVARHLQAWEKWTAQVTNFRAEVKLKRTDASTGNTKTLSGATLYMKPHFAVLRLNNPDDSANADYEAYICNETAVYAYNGLAKTVTEFKRPPTLNSEAALFGFHFLSGMKADELQERFAISLFKTDQHYLYLDIKPRLAKEQCEFQHLRLALYNPGPLTKDVSYLPAAAHVIKPDGEKEQWWFTNPQANIPGVRPEHFQYVEIRDKGWKVQKAPEGPKPAPPAQADGRVQRLIKAGDFAEAETLLRSRLPQQTGLNAAEDRLMLGICVLRRARDLSTKPGDEPTLAPKLTAEALKLFDEATAGTAGRTDDERAARVRTQTDVWRIWALSSGDDFDKLVSAATAVYERHQHRVEGLIALGVLHEAHTKRGDDERVAAVRKQIDALFAKLKDKPGAFPETFGEYSRGYWEQQWFLEEKRKQMKGRP
ncbi:TIGR03009 domain-containing protein [Gemmata sp. JC673]|uniref:TIGR03009 domain-containing protein n=1 Tax=Gemmata algarum TaxID=2975278 RepID=A0ABU5F091_9BACT|nr:TIGR03009 domain-containing protein [Gemmata algarum]MDY3560977.1 TIGR03009 domain-containing protein [Gemmata algarum]